MSVTKDGKSNFTAKEVSDFYFHNKENLDAELEKLYTIAHSLDEDRFHAQTDMILSKMRKLKEFNDILLCHS